ncbi:MAG: hypothetical protein HN778_12085 [Prolixibacteraceae bacterium]|nr:hypothetical protein [Prolixibacteraceae bacterium]
MGSFEIDFKNFSFEGLENKEPINEEPEIIEENKPVKTRRTVALKQRQKKTIYRRAFSEISLLDAIGSDFKNGEIYNCITAGDVDGLSYLKLMIRAQDLDYVLLSTWVMGSDDVLQIEEWLNDGKIKKIDIYVGEIFPKSYKVEYAELKRIITPEIGRIAVFLNHSKIIAGYGKKFHFGIQTSANINTNPRCENGSITINKEIFDFYKSYFDGIISFDKENKINDQGKKTDTNRD